MPSKKKATLPTGAGLSQADSGGLPPVSPLLVASWIDTTHPNTHDADHIGKKAAGLLNCPRAWVPPFLVLTREFARLLANAHDAIDVFGMLAKNDQAILDHFLSMFRTDRAGWRRLLVRSNSPTETLHSRGALQSFSARPDIQSIATAVQNLIESVAPHLTFVLLQPAIEPGLLGHLSNERRVSRSRNRWLVEWVVRETSGPRQEFILEAASAAPDSKLTASTEREVLTCLRKVAAFLSRQNSCRYHCEWIWSGHGVWIVQADQDPDQHEGEADSYLSSRESWSISFEPRSGILLHFKDAPPDRWRKLYRPSLFAQAGLPVADIFLVSGESWNDIDANRKARLHDDLAQMCRFPVVVRTDISRTLPQDDTLLPTSPPAENVDDLLCHMSSIADQLASNGISDEDWAFLLACLVPARASAMVHAHPNAQRVRVDALWGFPDGLLHFPHDTYFYERETRIIKRVRYKGVCVLPEDAGWIPRTVGDHLDWAPVLSDVEISTLATWGLRLARELQSEVQLMALARIAGKRGPNACLPWHFTTWNVPTYLESLPVRPLSSVYEEITSNEDIIRLRSQGEIGFTDIRGFIVRPQMHLLRDDKFLEAAAKFAHEEEKPLYFEGSLLGHAYYVMSRAGAVVIPVTPEEPIHKPLVYKKLVRDYVPMIIEKAGGLARVRTVSRSSAAILLKQKLIEESYEVWTSNDADLAEEIADVLDVIEALCSNLGIENAIIARIRDEKVEKRGGFQRLVYLEETDIRTLKAHYELQGELPLISSEVSSAPTAPSSRESLAIRSLPTGEADAITQFSVSLIPPVNERGAVSEIIATVEELLIEAQYNGSQLVITVRERGTNGKESTYEQLQLVPDEDE